jgi:hypothetical protein
MRLETEDDIQRLIDDRIPENYILEYKKEPWPEKKGKNTASEIAKDISSFANTQGGQIIVGVEEDKKTKEPIARHPFEISNWEERIEDIRHNAIKPYIEGLRIYRIKSDEQEGKGYLIVEIPESPNAPHMVTTSNKYYRRDNSGAKPMSEAEVRDLYEKRTTRERKLKDLYGPLFNKIEEEKAKVGADETQALFLFLPRVFQHERFSLYDKQVLSSLQDLIKEFNFHPNYIRERDMIHFCYGKPEDYDLNENVWLHPCGGIIVIGQRLFFPNHKGEIPRGYFPKFVERAFEFATAVFHKFVEVLEFKSIIYLRNVGKWHLRNFYDHYPDNFDNWLKGNFLPLSIWHPETRHGESDIYIERNLSLWQLEGENLQQFLKDRIFKEILRKFGNEILDE